mmetsp:Transcript_23092/g.60791  ORF Transcript_23092/g.60791 Transcript_23092/m.60791 type:complete len:222 (-) Transcript_23092:694-1359(-)
MAAVALGAATGRSSGRRPLVSAGAVALDGDAILGDAPHGDVDGRRVVEVDVGEVLGDRVGRLAGVIVRDRAVDVVGHVRRADLVVEPVEDGSVRPVHSEEGTAHVAELLVAQVGNVNVRVLEPRVSDEPHVGKDERPRIEREHAHEAELRRPRRKCRTHGHNADVRFPYLPRPLPRPELLREGPHRHEVIRRLVLGTAGCAPEQVSRPANREVQHQLQRAP